MPSNITVTATTNSISVNESTNNVSVTSTPTTVTVGTATTVSNTEIRSAISATDAGGDGSFSYNSSTGVFTYTGPSQAEVVAHFSNVTPINLEANGQISINDSALFSGKTTDDLAQGTTNLYFSTSGGAVDTDNLTEGSSNLYFTNARARQSLSTTGGILTYSNVSGEIGLTSANVRSQISATSPISYNSSTGVISTTLNGIESTSSELATEGVMANIHAIYPSGRQYTEPYDVGLAYDSSTGGLTVIYPQKSFEARFVNTAIDTTRGHVLAVVGYDATNDIPIVDYLDITNSANNIVAGVYMESIGTVSNSAVTYPKVAVATEGYITSGAFNGLSGLKTGDILYATTVGTSPNTRGGYTATIPTNAHDNIVSPIGKIVEQDGTLFTLYIDVAQTAINTSNITLTQGNATTTAGRPVISVDGSEITTGTGGSAGIIAVNTSDGHRLDLSLTSISTLSDAPGSFEVVGNSGGNNKAIALQDINLANLDNSSAGFVSNAQAKAFIESNGLNATANIETNQFFIGDGSLLTGVTSDIETESVQRLVIASENVAKGDAVAITGGTGDNPEVSKALASNVSLMPAFGVMLEAVTATNTGNCLLYGEHTSIDMGSFGVGEEIFVSGATAGSLSNVAPTGEANAVQKIGKVIKSGSGGKLTVQGAGRSNATPNLDNGKIFLGDSNNQSATVTPDSNFDTTNGTFSLSNSLSGIKEISSESATDGITLKDTNTLEFDPLLQSISYNAGRIKQTGTVINRQTAAIASEAVTSNFGGRVGSTHIAGLYVGSTHGVVGAAGGSITFTEGSTDVDIRGIQVTTGGNYLAAFGGSKAFADINTYFRAGQVIGLNRASGDFMGPQQKDTVITEVINSDGSNGHANVRLSKAAKYSETFTITTGLTDTIAITDQVSQAGNTNIRAVHGIAPTTFAYSTTDIKGCMVQDYQIEGTSENGANYFQFMTDTTLSQVNAEIQPNMLSKANVTDYYEIIDMESDKGFYRFPDTVLIGDLSGPESRNNYRDTLTSFGINVQWSGLDTDTRYPANTIQPALVFQNFTDNALQSQSGQEDRAGPRILLSSFTGNKNNPQLSWYPEQNQEIGKYGWWSTSGENAVPSGTIPPAAITGIAAHDWDVDANVSVDIVAYSSSRTASGLKSNYLAFLDGELELSALSSKKIKFGESGTMGAGSTIRGDATQTNTYATIDSTELELFNRLQLYSRTTAEINGLSSPQAGQMLYNSTLNQVVFYNGTEWRKITDSTM